MSESFQFKQFAVNHDLAAMKVGTDGVLLGAWSNISDAPNAVLDIGAGTGLLALMLAQRSTATLIDAIEIDENAYEQCVDNFESSPWADRLFCYHASLDEFTEDIEDTYDLIVCNPPFYLENMSSGNKARDIARQNDSLPFEDLLVSVSKLLSENGKFSLIIPYSMEEEFLYLATTSNLFPLRITRVKGNPTSAVKRSLLELSFLKVKDITITELTIEVERHSYTAEYIELTKDFYLNL